MSQNQKIVIIGFGAVSQCVLPILLKEKIFAPNQITIIEQEPPQKRAEELIQLGVTFIQKKITPENYTEVLSPLLNKGDFLLDLAWNIDTSVLLTLAHQKGWLYLNTSVEFWNPYEDENASPQSLTLYHRQMLLRDLTKNWKDAPSMLVDHGANPGLVSHFVKQALLDISQTKLSNPEIKKAYDEENFPELARLLGVKTIHISERDTQVAGKPKEPNEFVNTWSIQGLIEEGLAPAELGFGTHETSYPKSALHHESGPKNQICLKERGISTWVRSWVPSGPIVGMVIRHGEAYSLSHYLTVEKDGKVIYRPTVHYAYLPCDGAIASLLEYKMRGFQLQDKCRILNDEIIDGKDELGCLLMGDFGAWWIGSILSIHESRKLVPNQSATTVQVAISVVSSLRYLLANPKKGFLLPEDLDFRSVLNYAIPYLGTFVSRPVEWNPMDGKKMFQDYFKNGSEAPFSCQFEQFRV